MPIDPQNFPPELTAIPNWVAWRYEANPVAGKKPIKMPYDAKTGYHASSAEKGRHTWSSFTQVKAAYDAGYYTGMGFVLDNTGMGGVDIDNCVTDGVIDPGAMSVMDDLQAAYVEFSPSGNGLRAFGYVPPLLSGCKAVYKGLELELYTGGRYLTLTGNVLRTGPLGPLVGFAELTQAMRGRPDLPPLAGPRPAVEGTPEMVADLRSALMVLDSDDRGQWVSMGMALKALGADGHALWLEWGRRSPKFDPEDAARVWRSFEPDRTGHGAVFAAAQRKGWTNPRSRDFAALFAAAALYGVPPVAPAIVGQDATITIAPLVSADVAATVDALLNAIHSAPDWLTIHNEIIPRVKAAGVPTALMPRLEKAINKRLDIWDAAMPVKNLRMALAVPRERSGDGDDGSSMVMPKPDWADHYVYLQSQEMFFDMRDSTPVSKTAFCATYNREMPVKGDSPDRHDAGKFMTDHWGCQIVHDTMYYPGQPQIVHFEGRQWANTYSDSSLPDLTDYTADGVHAIGLFQKHLHLLCGSRDRVFQNMLYWMAHNVQHPGKKIRWAPLVKGIEGDGKSTISRVMSAAMGPRNVKPVGPDVLCNSGGFTDWAHGRALVTLEEIHMVGKDRYRLANMLKPIIANNTITVNVKGQKEKTVLNTCNQLALTNHSDAAAISDTDRRYFVIFSPFGSLSQMLIALGVAHARDHFDPVYDSMAREPGQWRRWLLETVIPEWFDVDGSAMLTDEKEVMASSGMSEEDQMVLDTLAEGAYGVTKDCFSSKHLRNAISIRAMSSGMLEPKPGNLTHSYVRNGFTSIHGGTIWWEGKNVRVWVRAGMPRTNDEIREILDKTKTR